MNVRDNFSKSEWLLQLINNSQNSYYSAYSCDYFSQLWLNHNFTLVSTVKVTVFCMVATNECSWQFFLSPNN